MKELYFSCDIETDGPIPGPYSMLSFGFSLVQDKNRTFYAELKPISGLFDPDALRVNGLDREKLIKNGEEPKEALERVSAWIKTVSKEFDGKPVFVASPSIFDGMFFHWYCIQYLGENPFGPIPNGLDLKSYWAGVTGRPFFRSGKRDIIKELLKWSDQGELNFSNLPHTHKAVDDAQELANILNSTFEYRKMLRSFLRKSFFSLSRLFPAHTATQLESAIKGTHED